MNANRILFFGLVMIALIGLESCKTTEDPIGEKPPQEQAKVEEVPFDEIANAYLTGYGAEGIEPGGIVIDSQADWDELTTKMNSINSTIDEKSVDFNRMRVLAYFDEIRGSGGYTVEFTSVSRIGQTTQVRTKKTAPTGDAIEIMTQPYSIVVIEKSDNTVVFVEE